MDLELSDEQRLLRESVERFLADRYGSEQRRRSAAEPGRWSREIWQAMADLGWLALAVPERDGGIGGGAVEVGLVAEGLGRALVLEPFLEAVLAARLLAALGTAEQKARLLPPLMDGSRRTAFAHAEGQHVLDLARLETVAEPQGAGWRLTGAKDFVTAGAAAADVVVTARIGDGGVGAFVIAARCDGLSIESFPTVDGKEACRLTLTGLQVGPEGRLGQGDATGVICETLDFAAVALSFEAVGCMDALLAATVAYTRTREQFGRPLAANQVLRHRMADMSVRCEEARSIALRAALAMADLPIQRSRAASAAKFKTGQAGRFVAEGAIQLHGGMGVTEELDIGLYAKRLLAIDVTFGTGDQHLRRHARLRPAP